MSEVVSFLHVSLSQGGNNVLDDVTFSIHRGEIVGLIPIDNLGLNELLSLFVKSPVLDRGRITYLGKEVATAMHGSSSMLKVGYIGTESHLFPSLSIEDNFFMMRPNAPYFARKKQMHDAFSAVKKEYGIDTDSWHYDEKSRCKIEMIKAVELGCKLIVAIDPGSFLGPKDAKEIKELMRRFALDNGTAFLYISSHHEELVTFTDRIMMMRNGSIIYSAPPEEYDDSLIKAVSGSFLARAIAEREKHPVVMTRKIGHIEYLAADIPVMKGKCSVILDFDNQASFAAYDSLYGLESPMAIYLNGKLKTISDLDISFIPAYPVRSLFPEMSYFDNLSFRVSEKIPLFWQLKRKYFRSILSEYGNDDVMHMRDLYSLTSEQLYDLVYRKVEFESPDAVVIIQPFMGLDLKGRGRVLSHITRLLQKGISVIIFAISLSDTLNVADTLYILQNGRIFRAIASEDFHSIPDILPMLR